jgi:hypothetical protein
MARPTAAAHSRSPRSNRARVTHTDDSGDQTSLFIRHGEKIN